MTAAAPDATTHGTLRLLWDGPLLYALVEVTGDSTQSDAATPDWNRGSYAPESDGLFLFMDVFNDQWGIETDKSPCRSKAGATRGTVSSRMERSSVSRLASLIRAGRFLLEQDPSRRRPRRHLQPAERRARA